MSLRILVIDAYDAAGRRSLQSVGATAAGTLYDRALRGVQADADIEVLAAGESAPLDTVDPRRFDGLVWTGSNLTIHRPDEMVNLQLGLARAAFAAGVPQFGSCWAIQLAAVAAGGVCARNLRGREFGIARAITLTAEGAAHPLLRGRSPVYEGFASHEDIVVDPSAGGIVLAGNDFCAVQALEVRYGAGVFWAAQYHPEYDFREVARLAVLRSEQLIREGRFADRAEAERFIADYEVLDAGGDAERRERQAVSDDVSDPQRRRTEIGNWIAALKAGELRS